MAKSNFIETKKAIDDITLAIDKQISSANELNSKVIALNSSYAKLPSEYVKNVNEIAVANEKIVKSENDVQRAIIATQKAKQASVVQTTSTVRGLSTQTKATREQAVANQILRAETDRNFKANTLLAGAYAKASAQLLILKKEAKDAAIAFGEESKQAKQAAEAASNLDQRIKSADKSVGDYQRNVGNYSNGVASGLGKAFSGLRQLAYLLPGIGIAGIFNLAFDALIPLIQQIDFFKKKFDALSESKKNFNEITIEANKNATSEIISLQGNLKIAQNINLSYKDRMIAVDNLQKSYPYYFENLTKEQILAGETTKAENALTQAILSRAKANAAIGKITENEGKIIDFELQRADIQRQIKKLNEEILVTEQKLQTSGNVSNSQGIVLSQIYDKRKSLIKDLVKLTKDQNDVQSVTNILTKYALKNQEQAIGLDYKEEKSKKDKSKSKREDLKAIDLTIDKTKGLIDVLEENKKSLQDLQRLQSKSSAEWKFYQDRIDTVNKAIEYLTKGNNDLAESAKKATDEFQKLHFPEQVGDELKKVSQYLQGFINDFASSAGLTATFDILQGRIEGFGTDFQTTFVAIAESAQEAFNFITKNMADNFAEQYAMLEKQKETELLFAGNTASAKANIENQYEERKRQIANKEAQAKKKQALFNIAIDTAQAVVAALPNIPLSVTIGLIGLAQLALVNSQDVPQFWKGTDNAPEGLAYTQERGREIITDKKGNIKSMGSNKGAQLTYLNQGDKVFDANKTNDLLMFNDNLNSILTNNGISNPKIEINSKGISDEQVNRIVSSIENSEKVNIYNDGTNIIMKRKRANELVEIANRRINFVGKSV